MEGVTRLAPQAGAVFQSLGTMRDGKSDTSEASHSLDAWRGARIRRDSEAVRTSKPPHKPNRVSLRGPAYRAEGEYALTARNERTFISLSARCQAPACRRARRCSV
jgi:hypothetical protein